jgi:hypothetical protein
MPNEPEAQEHGCEFRGWAKWLVVAGAVVTILNGIYDALHGLIMGATVVR